MKGAPRHYDGCHTRGRMAWCIRVWKENPSVCCSISGGLCSSNRTSYFSGCFEVPKPRLVHALDLVIFKPFTLHIECGRSCKNCDGPAWHPLEVYLSMVAHVWKSLEGRRVRNISALPSPITFLQDFLDNANTLSVIFSLNPR